jgi:hypothetical protein
MPWLTLDFKEREKETEISHRFDVSGIPTLILFDGDSGNIICNNAIKQIQDKDKKGKHFPWTNQKSKKSFRCFSCF